MAAVGITVEVHDELVALGGRELFTGTGAELIDRLAGLVASDVPALIVTPNVDQVLELEENEEFRRAFDAASLRLIDGMPIVILARILGARGVHRHTGADLLPSVAGEARERGWRVAITGGADDVIEAAVRRLSKRYEGADVVGIPFPLISSPDDERARVAVAQLREHEPDVVFLCLGAPKQELWFTHWREELPAAVFVGAGAAVDFAAGTVLRAPAIVQRLALEWLWRLAREPRRLARRYLGRGPRFLAVIARSIRHGRTQ